MDEHDSYDVAVIGGGVVGCAILHELTKSGYKCILLEKEPNMVCGASSGNSGMAHTGFDSDPAFLESKLIIASQKYTRQMQHKLNIPVNICGAIMIARTWNEALKLPAIVEKANRMGMRDVEVLSPEEIEQLEPNLSKSVFGGVLIPGEAVIDSWYLPIALAHQARRYGAKVSCSSEVRGVEYLPSKIWKIQTPSSLVQAKLIINAAGLFGDYVDELIGLKNFNVKPRKGQYLLFDKDAGQLINHMILPVPNERTKGIIIFPSIYGNLVIGPTAEEVTERSFPQTSSTILDRLQKFGNTIIPALSQYKPIGSYAGLRPATEHKDYQIRNHKDKQWITVGGIRSTGVSACLGISKYVKSLVEADLGATTGGQPLPQSSALPWFSDNSSVVLDGIEYTITHPLTKYGLMGKPSKL